MKKFKILTALAIVSDLVLLIVGCGCGNCHKFTTTTTQTNFYEYPDTINWVVGKNKVKMLTSYGCDKINPDDCQVGDNEVSYLIKDVNVYVKHYNK